MTLIEKLEEANEMLLIGGFYEVFVPYEQAYDKNLIKVFARQYGLDARYGGIGFKKWKHVVYLSLGADNRVMVSGI